MAYPPNSAYSQGRGGIFAIARTSHASTSHAPSPHPAHISKAPPATANLPTRADLLDELFQRDKENFCRLIPKGGELHTHSGTHHNTLLQHATNLFWNTVKKDLQKEEGCDTIPVPSLELQVYRKERLDFVTKVTQPVFTSFATPREANDHFHATFITSGLVDVPLSVRLEEEYNQAILNRIQHIHLMVDLPIRTSRDTFTLSENLNELTDETLECFCTQIEDWLSKEKIQALDYLKAEGSKATENLKLSHSLFSTDNPINISCQIEVGKCHHLSSVDSDPKKMLARFACDVALAMELENTCDFVLSVNFDGPEYKLQSLENQRAAIVDFFYRKNQNKATISNHAGELHPSLVSPSQMRNIASRNIEKWHVKRIGHGTCLLKEELEELKAKNVVLEVCPSACEKLLGHPYPLDKLLEVGIPFVISTDNRDVFDTNMGEEFKRLFSQWSNAKYSDLKRVARESLHSCDLRGESIFSRNVHGDFTLKAGFREFITSANVEERADFILLPPKQKVQIRHERAMNAFEDKKLLERQQLLQRDFHERPGVSPLVSKRIQRSLSHQAHPDLINIQYASR